MCITHSKDTFPVEWAIEHLNSAGVDGVRLNSDQFPLHVQIGGSMRPSTFSSDNVLAQSDVGTNISTEDWSIDESNIGAIWHRKNVTSDLSSA